MRGSNKVTFDSGDYYRDINAASYSKHPLEPAVVSVMKMNKKPIPVNIVACGSTIGNLLRFARGVDLDHKFRMLVEIIDDTTHLIRRENSPKQLIEGVKGCGHTFPEAYTTWDIDVRQSTSHQRVLAYCFDGLELMVRFEGDGYFPTPSANTRPRRDLKKDLVNGDDLADLEGLQIKTREPKTKGSLIVTDGGEMVAQPDVFDLKTRSTFKRDAPHLNQQLPRLWVTQVPKLILAYHSHGWFKECDIETIDVKRDVETWQQSNQAGLKRLGALLRLIINRARDSGEGKLEIVWACGRGLEIREQLPDAGDVLSASVRGEWSEWLGGQGATIKSEGKVE